MDSVLQKWGRFHGCWLGCWLMLPDSSSPCSDNYPEAVSKTRGDFKRHMYYRIADQSHNLALFSYMFRDIGRGEAINFSNFGPLYLNQPRSPPFNRRLFGQPITRRIEQQRWKPCPYHIADTDSAAAPTIICYCICPPVRRTVNSRSKVAYSNGVHGTCR